MPDETRHESADLEDYEVLDASAARRHHADYFFSSSRGMRECASNRALRLRLNTQTTMLTKAMTRMKR